MTFKELTPVTQREYSGGPLFTGNPDLELSALKNYDLRLDYTPHEGGLVSVSWFNKDVEDPIEYKEEFKTFTYTTAVNYPKGELSGYEIEVRQRLDRYWEATEGLSLGANATFIDSEVTLPADEADELEAAGFPMPTRDMVNAPEYLYNLYLTYDLADTGTQAALFYTVQGDTLLSGANHVESPLNRLQPSIYAKEYGTLNFSLAGKIGKHWRVQFQAKNLTNPSIEEFYRSDFIADDVTKSSFKKGREFSIGLAFNL